ncbi:MAG TPA: tetratricopeptide repeat protein [Nitratifractor sp.]|nr:tetratricopeptide repeat protein [Nitratifractor sp.]
MFSKMRALLSLVTIFLLPISVDAGLFDFKNSAELYSSYSAKDYNKSKEILLSSGQESPVYNYDLANVYYKLGRYQEALKYYKRAFGKDVDEQSRLHNLGNTYFMLNEYKKALSIFEIALKIRDDKDTRYNLELTKKLLQKKKEPKKSDKKKKQKEKSVQKSKQKSDKESKKKVKKLSKKELQRLNKLEKRLQQKKRLKKMLEKSFKDRKVPVIMYPLIKKPEEKRRPW